MKRKAGRRPRKTLSTSLVLQCNGCLHGQQPGRDGDPETRDGRAKEEACREARTGGRSPCLDHEFINYFCFLLSLFRFFPTFSGKHDQINVSIKTLF